MAAPFTEKEKKIVKKALKQAASDCVSTVGMRGATVERLAKSAGISKGAFYEFYETKELLFFRSAGGLARRIVPGGDGRSDEPHRPGDSERAARRFMRVCDIFRSTR